MTVRSPHREGKGQEPYSEDFENFKFKLRPYDKLILEEHRKTPWSDFIPLRAEDVWLDAGAHIGIFSVTSSAQVKKIVACEPDPDNFALLKTNIEENNCRNVHPLQVALGANSGSRTFGRAGFGAASGSMIMTRHRSKITIDALPIDEIIKSHKITKIKMDIEGAEFECLTSLSPEAWEQIQGIALEWHPKCFYESDLFCTHIWDLLQRKFPVANRKVLNKSWGTEAMWCSR